jgi:hypothetical protein
LSFLFAARFQEHVINQISAVDPRDHAQAQVFREPASMRLLLIRLIARHGADAIRIEYEIRGTESRVSNARTPRKTSQLTKFDGLQF